MEEILWKLVKGEIDTKEACKELKLESIRRVKDFARIDINRSFRSGISEIILAEGKRSEEVADIAMALVRDKDFALISRAREKDLEEIKKNLKEVKNDEEKGKGKGEGKEFDIDYNKIGRTIIVKRKGYEFKKHGKIGIIAAGTADIPVAEEARVVAEVCGCNVIKAYDVGIAGIHRLAEPLEEIMKEDARAIIVVSGMEGALPSVVASLVDIPVIGVPTSEGYGFGGKGVAALLSMLQSCSPGLVVVNIDNGVGAGTFAAKVCLRP